MTMRKMMTGLVAAAAMTTAVPAVAQSISDHEGAWQAAPAESAWAGGGAALPAGFKLVINLHFSPNHLAYHSVNTTDPAKPYISDHESSLDGTVAPFPNQTRFNQVSVKVTGPNDMTVLKMKDGDVIAGEFWSFSADGKTAIRRGVGKTPEGKSHAYEEHFVHVK
jgi:hypothetical protein